MKKEKIHIQWKFENNTMITCNKLEDQYLKQEIIRNIVSKKKSGFKLKYVKRVYTGDLKYVEFGYFENGEICVEQHITITDLKYNNLQKGAGKWATELAKTEEETKWTQKQLLF